MFVAATSQAEILLGLAIMAPGRKRDDLIVATDDMFAQDFAGRILPFDQRAASHYADIVAGRRRMGEPISVFDAQIAATARVHAMSVVTRDRQGFAECGIDVVDPWGGPS